MREIRLLGSEGGVPDPSSLPLFRGNPELWITFHCSQSPKIEEIQKLRDLDHFRPFAEASV